VVLRDGQRLEVAVGQAEEGAVAVRFELDDDRRRARRDRRRITLPAPGEDEPAVRDHLDELAGRDLSPGHANTENAAWLGVDLAVDPCHRIQRSTPVKNDRGDPELLDEPRRRPGGRGSEGHGRVRGRTRAVRRGQIMVRLKQYAESGRPNPVFT
jgi:hypothetical protein